MEPFDTPCDRCGNFAPLSSKFGPALCANCIERTVDPIQKHGFSLGGVLAGTARLARHVGPLGALMVVVASAPITVLSQFVELPLVVSNVYDLIFVMPVQMIVVHLAFQRVVLRVERPSLREAAKLVGSRYGALIGTAIVSGLLIFVFLLLLIVPGIVKAMSLALVMPIALLERADASTAIAQSTARMRGRRLVMFGAYSVAIAPLVLVFVVMMCLIGASIMASMDLGGAGPETTRAEELIGLVFELIVPALALPITLVQTVAYLQTAGGDEPRF